MNKKDNYSYKEILLALREEFLKNSEKMNLLKQYCECLNKKIDDYCFYIRKHHIAMDPILEVVVKRKLGKMETLINNIKSYLLGYYQKTVSYMHGVDNLYRSSNEEFSIQSLSNKYEEFCQLLDEILLSDFANMMFGRMANLNKDKLDLNPNMLSLCLNNSTFTSTYFAHSDSLEIDANGNTISKKMLDYVFNISFPKKVFSSYCCDIIDSSNAKEKEIIYPDGLKKLSMKKTLIFVEDDRNVFLKQK